MERMAIARGRLPASLTKMVRRHLGKAERVDTGYRPVPAAKFAGVPVGRAKIYSWSWFQGTLIAEIELDPDVRAVAFVGVEAAVEVRVRGGCRVVFVAPAPAPLPLDFAVRCETWSRVVDPGAALADAEQYHRVFQQFVGLVQELPVGSRVLEIGARVVLGGSYRHNVPPHVQYTGFDVERGEGVDVVGDAHQMGLIAQCFDAVMSVAVFEHLFMPWKVVLEFNRILKPGGLVFAATHQAYPLHEEPWDFWRYSAHAWPALFNSATGFEILGAEMGEPVAIVPLGPSAVNRTVAQGGVGQAGSVVLAKKVGETSLRWDVSLSDVLSTHYPAPG